MSKMKVTNIMRPPVYQYSVQYSENNGVQCTVQLSVQYMYVVISYAVKCLR